ncbi:glycosyltransferase family 2 protein [Marinitenerispora sediminis]|uniref:Glucosyl-3-phosphoglycerate synthase n=1 Tax=Marinitenerispora sediminis TaxID=1931232 RepID=A0A368T121_9ACTN|nr:glycosyltransferase [Marinitenerispora sediminis]RCV50958.1 glycosyl transferase family 2 [Marinitenerispora sediminis]RCV53129.1 glycosyl transferase family 2 [Marinitenerispora sediminis]RCV60421.1 glycosyl transferase family 2 [Marinitenerispora sediminis]
MNAAPDRQDNVAVVIAAKDESDRIAATVRAARTLPGVDLVLVVDDGSTDGTAAVAADAGARVLRHSRNRGKGAAMETGAEGVRLIEAHETAAGSAADPRHLLFLDADLADTAAQAAPLVAPVRDGEADMTIALFPATRMRLGGHGFVVRLAREGIRRATGWEAEQPLNGQRCLTRAAFEAARPLAPGFGVETGLTIDLLHRGFRLREVEVPLEHRATGTDLRAQLHRARQFADVGRALAARELGPAAVRGMRRVEDGVRDTARTVSRRMARIRRDQRAKHEEYPDANRP